MRIILYSVNLFSSSSLLQSTTSYHLLSFYHVNLRFCNIIYCKITCSIVDIEIKRLDRFVTFTPETGNLEFTMEEPHPHPKKYQRKNKKCYQIKAQKWFVQFHNCRIFPAYLRFRLQEFDELFWKVEIHYILHHLSYEYY